MLMGVLVLLRSAVTAAVNHLPRRTESSSPPGRFSPGVATDGAPRASAMMASMPGRIHSRYVIACVMSAFAVACGGGSGSGGAGERPAANARADGPGVVTGKISYEGAPPARTPLRMDADPNCTPSEVKALSESTIVGASGGLQNVFVHVVAGLGNRIYETPGTPIVVDQEGCRYEPHVFGVFVGQPVEIHNSDPTLHNVHAIPKVNDEFNRGQQANTPPFTRTFD